MSRSNRRPHPRNPLSRSSFWAILILGILSCTSLHEAAFECEDLIAFDVRELSRTVVTPTLAEPLVSGRNVLWCGSFQLAWNEACRLVGEDLRFENEPLMVAELNEKTFTRKDLDKDSYVAVADFVGKGVYDRIAREMEARFGSTAAPRLKPERQYSDRPQDIVAYAYLFKQLEFAVPFERISRPLRFARAEVACFGMDKFMYEQRSLQSQVIIYDYRNKDDFVVELKTKSEGDRLILAKVEPGATLLETVGGVRERVARSSPITAQDGDVLKVPRMNFDLNRRYTELMGLKLTVVNPEIAKDIFVIQAEQNTRFKMDEKGVILRSESAVGFGCSSAQPKLAAMHVMIFDKPFLVMMERVDAKAPYLVLWVDNAELLLKRIESTLR